MTTVPPPVDPYSRLAKREIYSNKWLRVEAHTIVHPNGHPGEHVLIISASPSGVVVIDGDDVLLVAQPRFAARQEMVEIVKGGGEPGEDALAAAKRELAEELGFTASMWQPLGQAWELPSLMENPISIFLARDLQAVPTAPEATESLRLVRMPLAAAVRAAYDGALSDGVTVTALLRCAKFLEVKV